MAHGILTGWLSPAMLILMGPDSPMNGGPITVDQLSWIGTLSNVGALIGNFGYTTITNYFGRKKALCLLALPNIVSNL